MDKILKWLGKSYLILIFLIPVIPQSNTMDVVGLQWFVFSMINLIGVTAILPKIRWTNKPKTIVALWIVFVLIALLSTTYSINLSLGLQDISRWSQVIIGIILLKYFFQENILSYDYLTNVILGFLFIESIYILIPLFVNLYVNGFGMEVALSPGLFNGLTGNKNIAAASVMIKLPFVLHKLKNLNIKSSIVAVVLIILSILSVLFIAARASYISLLLTTAVFLVGSLFYIKESYINKTIYLFGPLVLAYIIGFGLGNKFIKSGSASSLTNKVESISFTREGSSGRTLLWSDAISFIKDHPITGGGIGSWKIESAPYWNIHGTEYLVPYHAHNDFLEITAELGILGGLLYVIIFSRLIYLLVIRIKSNRSEKTLFYFVCLASLGTYFIDALLNFPMERYIMQIMICVLFSVGAFIESKNDYEKNI